MSCFINFLLAWPTSQSFNSQTLGSTWVHRSVVSGSATHTLVSVSSMHNWQGCQSSSACTAHGAGQGCYGSKSKTQTRTNSTPALSSSGVHAEGLHMPVAGSLVRSSSNEAASLVRQAQVTHRECTGTTHGSTHVLHAPKGIHTTPCPCSDACGVATLRSSLGRFVGRPIAVFHRALSPSACELL